MHHQNERLNPYQVKPKLRWDLRDTSARNCVVGASVKEEMVFDMHVRAFRHNYASILLMTNDSQSLFL